MIKVPRGVIEEIIRIGGNLGRSLKMLREKLKRCDGNKKLSKKGDKIDVFATIKA